MADDDLKRLFDEMRQENAAAHAETRRRFEENAAAHVETRRYFAVAVERMDARFDALAETVGLLDEKLDRKTAALDEKIERTAAETQAMIKFSHAELDRRFRTLEDTVADLQARVERLESTTH